MCFEGLFSPVQAATKSGRGAHVRASNISKCPAARTARSVERVHEKAVILVRSLTKMRDQKRMDKTLHCLKPFGCVDCSTKTSCQVMPTIAATAKEFI